MSRLVLIDRDGTINKESYYLCHPKQIKLIPRVAEGIKILQDLDLYIAIVSNQSAVGRGYFDLDKLKNIHEYLNRVLAESGAKVDAIYFCPHLPEDGCECRKPATAMAQQAACEFGVMLSESFVIGDNMCDIKLGKNIGATTILVRTGYGKKIEKEGRIQPDYIVESLYEAAILIKEILEKCQL